jgi:hypothetical protein
LWRYSEQGRGVSQVGHQEKDVLALAELEEADEVRQPVGAEALVFRLSGL